MFPAVILPLMFPNTVFLSSKSMPKGKKSKKAYCCVGGCNNDDRYPDNYKYHSHVTTMEFFNFTTSASKRVIWIRNVQKGQLDFFDLKSGTFICANHFKDGKPTPENPHPTEVMTKLSNEHGSTPKKRKKPTERTTPASETLHSEDELSDLDFHYLSEGSESQPETAHPDFTFEIVTTEGMVSFFRKLLSCSMIILDQRQKNMNYWKGEAQVRKERQSNNAARSLLAAMFDEFKRAGAETPSVKRGPQRKLQLEEELLLTLMRLRLGLFVEDLAFRFKVSHSLVTQFFSTWVGSCHES